MLYESLQFLVFFSRKNHPYIQYFVNLEQYTLKKNNKADLNTVTFYSEDENRNETNFKGEMLTFTLQIVKI